MDGRSDSDSCYLFGGFCDWVRNWKGEVMVNKYTLSVRLEKELKQRGMMQRDLAKASGLNDGTISRYLRMQQNATDRSVKKIADALGVSCEYLGVQ